MCIRDSADAASGNRYSSGERVRGLPGGGTVPGVRKPGGGEPSSGESLWPVSYTHLACGYPDFAPDACLINRYQPGAKLSLHQDKDERDLRAPIAVSYTHLTK